MFKRSEEGIFYIKCFTEWLLRGSTLTVIHTSVMYRVVYQVQYVHNGWATVTYDDSQLVHYSISFLSDSWGTCNFCVFRMIFPLKMCCFECHAKNSWSFCRPSLFQKKKSSCKYLIKECLNAMMAQFLLKWPLEWTSGRVMTHFICYFICWHCPWIAVVRVNQLAAVSVANSLFICTV